MPDYRKLTLQRRAPATPPHAAVPLAATEAGVLHQTLAGLDTLPPSGERVLLEFGLKGGDSFLIPNGVAYGGVTQIYPDRTTPRVVARLSSVNMTPGHFVFVHLIALPSGPASIQAGGPYNYDGAGGLVRVEVTYTNSDAQTIDVSFDIDIPASQLLYAAEPTAAHFNIIEREGVALPTPLVPAAIEWQKWTRDELVLADIVVSYIGAPRVIDGVVSEIPHSIVVDRADALWPTCMYTVSGQPYQQLPSDYPIEQLSSTDPAGGFNSIRRALVGHRKFGPFLFGWTSAIEHSGDINDWVSYNGATGDDEAPAVFSTGTTPTVLPFGATTPSDQLTGWPTGHYATLMDHGDHFLDGRVAVLPVWVYARCRVSAGTGTYQLITNPGWSEIRWTTTSTTWTDVLVDGWLETGIGPENDKPARLWTSNSGANNTYIRDLACWYRPQ